MAGEEDVELRDLVAQTLEAKGVLGKIRAQLRASVFLALEEQPQEKRHPFVNESLREYLKTKDGQLVAGLVREFMEFFELDFTCSVFDPETNVLDSYPGREKLARDIGLDPRAAPNAPLLASLLQQSTHSSASRQLRFPDPGHPTATQASVPPLVLTGSTRTSAMTTTTSLATNAMTTTSLATNAMTTTSLAINAMTTTTSLATSAKTTTASAAVFSEAHPLARTETTVSARRGPESRIVDSKFNSNENSNLGRLEPRVSGTGTKSQTDGGVQPADPSEMTGASSSGVRAELGEGSSFNVEELLKSSKSNDEFLKRPTEQSSRDELDDFFDKPLPSVLDAIHKEGGKAKPSSGGETGEPIEDLSHISSLTSGKYETTDLTLSQNSLTGDFDYTEPAQS